MNIAGVIIEIILLNKKDKILSYIIQYRTPKVIKQTKQ